MISLYECAQEIKKATGWSQERIGVETGLALSTINRVFRVVGYRGNETSHRLIKKLHQEVVQSPFPDYLERLFEHYDERKEKSSKRAFAEYLNVMEALLQHHQSIGHYSLEACRIYWLLGHFYFDRAFFLIDEMLRSATFALDCYEKSLEILQQQSLDNFLLVQQYKIQQCIVSTKFNLHDPNTRANNAEIRHWLWEMGYIKLVEQVVKEDSWNWMAARNGLVAASILKDFEKCLFFWQVMIRVSKKFENLSFVPALELPSIVKDRDLVWFVEQLKKEEV
jgi:transcriptional regulator with XRE-family HTH domain